MTSTASTHRNSAAYASATSSAISARSRGSAASRAPLLGARSAVSRPALTSRARRLAQEPTRCAGGGGSASARLNRSAAASGAPLSHRCLRRLPQAGQHPAIAPGRTLTRCAAICPGGALSACSRRAAERWAASRSSLAQRRLDRVADDRVDEARTDRQSPRTSRRTRPAASWWRPSFPSRRRSPPRGAARSRPPERPAPARDEARQDRGAARGRSPRRAIPSQPAGQQLGRIALGQLPVVELGRPQQLGLGTAGCRRWPSRRAAHSSIAAPVAHRGADECADGALAQQRRAQDRRRFRAQRQQRRAGRRRLTRPQRHEQRHRQALQPRRKVGQPAQRGLVRPVRIIDREQQRLTRRIGWRTASTARAEPQTTVAGRASTACPSSSGRAARRARRATPRARPASRAGQAPLEQLPHHAEREVRLELRPAGTQDLRGRARAARRHAASTSDVLPMPAPALDRAATRAAALQQLLNCCQLALALEQAAPRASL